jgi:hypothetical protein
LSKGQRLAFVSDVRLVAAAEISRPVFYILFFSPPLQKKAIPNNDGADGGGGGNGRPILWVRGLRADQARRRLARRQALRVRMRVRCVLKSPGRQLQRRSANNFSQPAHKNSTARQCDRRAAAVGVPKPLQPARPVPRAHNRR